MEVVGFKTGDFCVENKKEKVIPPVDFQHILCQGATGSGKTASMILPTLYDRMERGHTIIFFDHKGHEHKKVKALAKKVDRLQDVVEIGKPHASYINILAELDTIRLKEMIKGESSLRDPYWANSAANLLEDIIVPWRKLYGLVTYLKKYKVFTTHHISITDTFEKIGIDIYAEPSFKNLSSIIASPKSLTTYIKIMKIIPSVLEEILTTDYAEGVGEIPHRRPTHAKILSLKNSVTSISRFTLSDRVSEVNSGNNAVLQTLDNSIASYAKKEYMNTKEYTISSLMDKNAIIVIDTQSFGDDMMKLFLESILKKSVMRLRLGTESAMSIFIDEANRVLFPSIDLHSDVLREAKVELVIAIQNEEQMISKFSQTVWDSIKGNIKHQYRIDIEHHISYNNMQKMHTEPLLLNNEALSVVEYDFYTLEKNRLNIQKNFLGEVDNLPERFRVIYDLDRFGHEAIIVLEDNEGKEYAFTFHGQDIVKEVSRAYYDEVVDELNQNDSEEIEDDRKNSLFYYVDEKDETFDDLPGLGLKIEIEYEDAIPF